MFKAIKTIIKNFYFKRGFKFNDQFVIFESDDWGAIRSNKEALKYLKEQNLYNDLDSYQKYDCLETSEDLKELFNVLIKYKDSSNNFPIFQLNYIMKNITSIDLKSSSYKLEDSFKSYKSDVQRVRDILQEGIFKKVFYPQLHGLIHLNISKLIEDCKTKDIIKNCFFNFKAVGFSDGIMKGMDTFGDVNQKGSISIASKLFEKEFKYKTKSMIFPCYTWNKDQEKELAINDIHVIQGGMFQYNSSKRKLHYNGQKNDLNQYYFVRNCFFEPNKNREKGILNRCVNDCLNEIEKAFKYNKPAIICTHRCNFVGGINKKVRNQNLNYLSELIAGILKRFPKCKFITTFELVKIMGERNGIKNI